MFCEQCGAKARDDAVFCPACGARIERPPAAPPPRESVVSTPPTTPAQNGGSQAPPYRGDIPYVKNFLVESILATICCSILLGVPGIVYAAQVDKYLRDGNVEAAAGASDKAKKWALIALVVGFVVRGGLTALTAAGVFSGIANYWNYY